MDNFLENGLYIDGEYYHVPIISIKRDFDILWKWAERTEEGEHEGELLGGYFNYTINFGSIVSEFEYNRLYSKLTDMSQPYHEVFMPNQNGDGFYFKAYFNKISDSVKKAMDGKVSFNGLSVKLTAKKQAR